DLLSAAVVDVGGGQQRDPAVAVLEVVPAEEALAERSGVLDGAEPVGEGRVVLEGLELALGVGVVVGDVRAAVGAGDAQVAQEHGDRLGGHRGPPVGVYGQRASLHALGGDGAGQQPLGQAGGLPVGDHPADHVAAVEGPNHRTGGRDTTGRRRAVW